MNEQNTKQKELETLYLLREKLSELSKIRKQAEQIEHSIMQKKNQIISEEENINRLVDLQEDELSKKQEKEENYQNEIDSVKASINERRKPAVSTHETKIKEITKKRNSFIMSSIYLFIELIVGSFFVIALGNATGSVFPNPSELTGILSIFPMLLIIDIIMFVVNFFAFLSKSSKIPSNRERQIAHDNLVSVKKQLAKEQDKLNGLIKNKAQAMTSIQNEYNNIISDHKQQIAIHKQNITDYNKKIDQETASLNITNSLYGEKHSLVKEGFAFFLDERDWENVDSIILKFETGRALNLRDSLVQIDNEKHINQVKNTIYSSSNSISNDIVRGFINLECAIRSKLDDVNRNFSNVSNQMSDMQSSSLTQARELERLVSLSAAQEALLNDLNSTNDSMARDLEKMRKASNIN